MSRFRIAIALASMGLASTTLAAQSSASSGKAVVALEELQSTLRMIVIAEEAYFSEHYTYTSRLTALQVPTKGRRSNLQLSITFLHVGENAWSATAEHPGAPGRSCVVFVGRVPAHAMPATSATKLRPLPSQEGTPVCDPEH